jgi:hypothetical protein
MIQLAAFWKRESKNGRVYYQGKMGQGRLLLFSNKEKKTDKAPDLLLYVVSENSKQNGQPRPETKEDDVPF